MDKSKPFGLIIPKKTGTFRPKICNAFESDSDDDKTSKKKSSAKIPQSKPISVKTEDLGDPSIYEYDAIYDDMKAQKAAEVAPKVKKSSRYIDNLLKAADKRKKEYERRVERKVQVEREKEGSKFEDKEMFVSASYKKKLQEREEEEERERRENQLNDMMDVTKQKDLSGFYRHFLKQSVGEEKIPVFGERHAIKREPDSGSDSKINSGFAVKKEPLSDSDQEQASAQVDNSARSTHSAQDQNFEDADDPSSAEESGNEGENSYERSVRVQNLEEKDKVVSDEESPDRSSCDKSLETFSTKRHNEESSSRSDLRNSKKRTKVFSDEDIENSPKLSKKSKHTNLDHDILKSSDKKLESLENIEKYKQTLNEENESSDSDDRVIINENVHVVPTNGTKEVNCNNNSSIPKIYEKRAIGDLFAAAQARYFQRLASRTSV